jgi:gliding motility-associated-like protein
VVQGWRTTASDQMMEYWPVPNYENVPAYSGIQFIELNANLVSGVYQDYQTPEVTTFTYGFAHRGRQGTDTCQLLAGPPGGPYTPVGAPVSTGNTAWSYNTGTYNVPAGQTVTRFIFQSVSSVGGASVGNYLDAITFTANNGILSPNPYTMDCGDLIANVNAAGTGTWVPHASNPSAVVIANASSGNTTISDFSAAGIYHFDWVTQYCTSTLEISFTGDEVLPPVVEDVTYCQGETATELTAIASPGNFINWFDGAPPVPNTSATGTFTYYVSQIAPNGCESVATSITVTVNPPGDAVTGFTLPDALCAGSAAIQPVTAPGFTGGGTFSAEPGLDIDATTGEINPASSTPGEYTVSYDVAANECTGSGSTQVPFTVYELPAQADVTVTQPDCTTATGTITINSPAGTGYTYSINGADFQAATTFSGLSAGDYSVTVLNQFGCSSVLNGISVNAAPVVPAAPTISVVQPTCTVAGGTINVIAPVGAAFTYSINGTDFQASPVFNDVIPGNYTVTVTNTDGCSATATAVINTQPPTPAVPVAAVTNPDCTVATGTLTVSSPTGAGLTYSLNGINYQSGTVFSGLAAGDYIITVKNAQGCTAVSSVYTIDIAPAPVPAINRSITQPNCTVFTGEVTVNAPIGPQYTYSLNGADYQSGTVFTGVASGSYTLTVLNTDGCTATSAVVINDAPGVPAVPVVTATQPDCSMPWGTLVVNSPVGAGITYSLDGINYQVSNIFTGLAQGTYTVTVLNSFGCSATSASFTINAPPALAPSPQLSASQPDCLTGLGAISVGSPLGAGYTYSIDGVNYQSSTLFTGLIPGVYTILAKSPDGCLSGSSIVINPAPGTPAVASVAVSQPDCTSATGTITVTAPTGAGLTYSIDGVNFQQGTVFLGLSQGFYTITVKNNVGCISVTAPVAVNAPLPIPQQPQITATQPTCTNPTGTITVTAPLGAGLTYSIDGVNFQASPQFAGLTPGITYNVTVQNGSGCTATSLPRTLYDAPVVPAVPVVTINQPDCESSRGFIRVESPAGADIRYSINGISFQPGNLFTNIVPGTYTITVRNGDGCTASVTVTVNQPPAVSDAGTINGPAQVCENDIIQFTATVADGTWSVSDENRATISSTGELTALSSGNVIVNYTVQNPGECAATASLSVWVAGAPQPVLNNGTICRDIETGEYGTAELNTGLSAADYSFVWYKGSDAIAGTDGSLTVTEPGSYTVEVTSLQTGCTGSATATVIPSSRAVISVEVGQDFNYNQTITVNVTGGSGDYEYQLNMEGYQDSPVFTGIREGEYLITVRDKNGCGLTIAEVYALNYPRFFSPNGDGENDTWFVEGLKDREDAGIYIFDRYGKVVGYVGGSNPGWDGTLEGNVLPATDYWFKLFYTSSSGTKKEFKAHFSLIR